MNRTLVTLSILLLIMGCRQDGSETTTKKGLHPKEFTFGIIGKSNDNPVFLAAQQGAMDAGKDLGDRYKVNIMVTWRTPDQDDAQKQATIIDQFRQDHVSGIGISVSDASRVTPAIDAAVAAGIPVMCWDSDAPTSKRFCYHGLDNFDCGRQVMEELGRALGEKGVIAILAGTPSASNLQERVRGIKETAAKYSRVKIIDVYTHAEDPQAASAKVIEMQTAHPEINGWAMIGGWALMTDTIRKDPRFSGGQVKIVAVDALPECLNYVRAGVAQAVLAQGCYQWGYRAVETLYDKALNGPGCPEGRDVATLTAVTPANVEEFSKKWDKWLPNRKPVGAATSPATH